ncbi:hypothetical protein GS433_17990 [Rhodococcus hoagii]|nr:hypothetical protein [Prescottella equi]
MTTTAALIDTATSFDNGGPVTVDEYDEAMEQLAALAEDGDGTAAQYLDSLG